MPLTLTSYDHNVQVTSTSARMALTLTLTLTLTLWAQLSFLLGGPASLDLSLFLQPPLLLT